MMPQTNPQCSSMDQPEHDLLPPSRSQEGCTTEVVVEGRMKADPGQRNGGTASSSPESGSQNGDGKRGGKSRRRRKHSANPESSPATAERKGRDEGKLSQGDSHPLDSSSVLLGLRSECASVWFDRSVYEQAESLYQSWLTRSVNGATRPNGSHHLAELHFVEESRQLMAPNSLVLPNRPTVPATPDEGYLSLAPTPATPTTQVTTPPSPRQPVNGLPRIPMELLRDVWMEKPLYDRAEAAFYQNLYGNNLGTTNSRISCSSSPSNSRSSSDHPQSLVEVEEEEEEEEVVSQTKAEVFHALHPIKEEEEPADVTDEERLSVEGVSFFLHPDSERVWLAKGRYEAAESHFYGQEQAAAAVEGAQGKDTEASSVTCTGPLRDNTMSAVDCLAQEKIWFDKPRYDDAERHFYEGMNGPSRPAQEMGANSILQDIARARENIQKSLAGLKSSLLPSRGNGQPPLNRQPQLSTGSGAGDQGELVTRIRGLELENNSLHQVVEDLRSALSRLECRVADLEKSPVTAGAPAPCTNGTAIQQQKTSAPEEEEEEEDDDIDLFGSDEEEDVEAERLKEQRVKEYAERKAKKPTLIAKSSILLDVKPWDDETDMAKLEECVRTVQADGLLWGSSKLVPVGYGIKKLQIQCVVEDDKVGTDLLEEEITKFEDYVQSVDVAAFNKI